MLGERIRGRCGLMRVIGPRCKIIGIILHIKSSPKEIRGTRFKDGEDGELGSTRVVLSHSWRRS